MELISKLIGSRLLSAIFLFLVSFTLFSPSLQNDFVWDDVEVITKGNVTFDAPSIIRAIVPESNKNKEARYYRPAFYTSVVIDKELWGLSPFGFHLANIVFHSVSVILFYFMVLLILKEAGFDRKEGAAFLSALLFALHPMHVESVSWVAGRTDVLCALFLFLSVISHILSWRKQVFLVVAGLSFSLALFSKEVAVVFPLLVLVLDLLNKRLFKRGNLIKYAVYTGIIVVYLYLRGRAFVYIPGMSEEILDEGAKKAATANQNISQLPGYIEFVKVFFNSYLIYLNKLIFPFDFNAFITRVPREIAYFISSAVLLIALFIISVVSIRKKENMTVFGILWVLITLGPSVLVAVFSIASTPAAERYLYIPSAGFCLLLGYWIVRAGKVARLRKVARGAGLVLIIIYAVFAYQRQGVWKNDLELWRDTSLKSPGHPLPHANYGLALSNWGRDDEAVWEFQIALSEEMNDSPRGKAVTANNLGLVYLEREEYREAEKWFVKAREYDPHYGRTYYHLGLIYYIKGELANSAESFREAELHLRKALGYYYSYGKANLLLAKIYLRRGEKKKAAEEARAAIKSGLPEHLLGEAREIAEIDNGGSNQEPQ
ncbi:MAG: tetratricopeptide repeat protein [Deltaproteobacteria bacterium]